MPDILFIPVFCAAACTDTETCKSTWPSQATFAQNSTRVLCYLSGRLTLPEEHTSEPRWKG